MTPSGKRRTSGTGKSKAQGKPLPKPKPVPKPKARTQSSDGRSSDSRSPRPRPSDAQRRETPSERSFSHRSALPLDGEQVEGRRAVRELLVAGRRRAKKIYISNELDPSDIIDEIKQLAGPLLRMVNADRIAEFARTESHQGVVAFAEPIPNYEMLQLVREHRRPFIVALDGVTDPGNLGAILRTAETAGVTGVLLPRKRSAHLSPTVAKSAAGAIEYIPIALTSGIPGALDRLAKERVWIVGLDGDATQTLDDLEVANEPLVLVFGAEGRGLSPLTKKRCDVLVKIPMYGKVESMNVSAAAAVALHTIARRRQIAQFNEPDGPDDNTAQRRDDDTNSDSRDEFDFEGFAVSNDDWLGE